MLQVELMTEECALHLSSFSAKRFITNDLVFSKACLLLQSELESHE